MGALARLWPGIEPADLQAAATLLAPSAVQTGIASPWGSNAHLETVVWSDIFGAGEIPRALNRAEAMRLPEVARARHVICSTLSRVPLRDYRGPAVLPEGEQAAWIGATDDPMSPMHRMLWTADDLFFYGWSCWRRTVNDAAGRFPLRMRRIPVGEWHLEPATGRVLIYKPDPRGPLYPATLQPARSDEVVLIPGPHEGILVDGADTLRHTADLHRAASKAAQHPSAYIGLSQLPGSVPLKQSSDDPTEVTAESVVAGWVKAREGQNGGVAFLGQLTANELGTFSEHLLIEGRNAAAVDVARHASLPADLIDATLSKASLQYTTSRDNDRRGIDYGSGFYMSAISAALSQDPVHPHGRRVAFDIEEWLAGTAPGEPVATDAPGLSPGAVPTSGETPT